MWEGVVGYRQTDRQMCVSSSKRSVCTLSNEMTLYDAPQCYGSCDNSGFLG